MNKNRLPLLLIPVLLFVLACQTVMAPVEQVQETGSTAIALATEASGMVTQVSGLATEAGDFATQMAPFATAVGIPTDLAGLPDNLFNPKDPPLAEWRGVPVMPEALGGSESDGMYGYTIQVDVKAVEEFYADKLPSLGWTETFSMPNNSGMAILLYEKDGMLLTVTITTVQDHLLVMLTLQ